MTTYTIWYMTPEHFPNGIMGALPAPDLSTHRSLGMMGCAFREPPDEKAIIRNLNLIFYEHQAEPGSSVWPLDESGIKSTNRWLESLGLEHTSMSVGDVIEKDDGRFWVVANHGFKEITDYVQKQEKENV